MTQSSESRTPTLAVPGVVSVGPDAQGGLIVQYGVAAGWIHPPGISQWSHELSLVARADVSTALRDELGLTMPENRIAKGRHPLAHKAAESMPFMGVTSEVVPKLLEKGVRVHTVGFDRVTGGFMYFAEGGKGEPVKVHGDLLEMISPQLEKGEGTNAEIETHLDRFIDRLLVHLSNGQLDELRVELANALPRLSTDARGLQGVDLDAFEAEASANAERSKKHEDGARKLASALDGANGASSAVKVPLFGEAKPRSQPAIAVLLAGAQTTLPARALWTVSGAIQEEKAATPKPAETKPAAATPIATPAAAKAEPKPTTPKPAVAEAKPTTPKPAVVTPAAGTPKPAAAAAARATPTPVSARAGTVLGMPAAPTGAAEPIAPRPTPAPATTPKPVPATPADVSPAAAAPAVAVARTVSVSEPGAKVEPIEAPKAEEKKPEPAPVEAKKAEEPKPKAEEKPAEKKPEPKEEKPAAKAEEKKPAEKKPEEKKAAEKKPEEKKAAEKKAEEKKPAAKEAAPKTAAKIEKAEPAPAPQKSSAAIYIVLLLLVAAAVAFFLMKKH